jgi:acetylornithine deacetylase/succinyl-diaminopimelate desuccinylase-like protein
MHVDLFREIQRLIAVDTSTAAGGAGVVALFRDMLYFGEFTVLEQSVWADGGEQSNIIGVRGELGTPGGLLLCASLRSDPPSAPETWTETLGSPLRATRRNGRIYGAGILSGKVDLLLKVVAAQRVPRAELVRPIYLAGLFGGELSGDAGGELLMQHPYVRPTAALVGHPTNLQLGTEHRGHQVLRWSIRRARNIWRQSPARAAWLVEFQGAPAHATAPQFGTNAIELALNALIPLVERGVASVHNLSGGLAANEVPGRCSALVLTTSEDPPTLGPHCVVSPAPETTEVSYPCNDALLQWAALRDTFDSLLRFPPRFDGLDREDGAPATFTLGRIDTTPEGLSLVFDVRTTVEHDVEALLDALEGHAATHGTKPGLSTVLEVVKDQSSFSMGRTEGERSIADIARKALRKLKLPQLETECVGHTEAWILNACGLDTLVFGAGTSAGVLGLPNEWVSENDLRLAVDLYEAIIRAACCA